MLPNSFRNALIASHFSFRTSNLSRERNVAHNILQLLSRNSSSSTRWKARQSRDQFSREAKVQGLKSRAAFKLLEINQKYRLFKAGATVVDLGYAPGSWSQVAIDRTQPGGRVVGIDIIPAQPPRGVSTIQGNFLSPEIQAEVRAYVQDPTRGRPRRQISLSTASGGSAASEKSIAIGEPYPSITSGDGSEIQPVDISLEELVELERGYIEMERAAHLDASEPIQDTDLARDIGVEKNNGRQERISLSERDERAGRVVDVVLSDMSAPWQQTAGFFHKSVSDAYHRMMNTSGNTFRDHARSMDLCMAALTFAFDTLRTGGHFVCKYYQGVEDKDLESRMKKLFEKVHREKPEASRKESKEGFFVGLRRRESVVRDDVLA